MDIKISLKVYEQNDISIVKYLFQNMYQFQWGKVTLQWRILADIMTLTK